MNFLAHLYLSSDEPDALAGSLMPDLVRGPLPADALPCVAAACNLHRCVDAFTDTHPVVACSKARIRGRHGRYAGILMDIFYDHYLARDWSTYSQQPLTDFVSQVYGSLQSVRGDLPPSMHGPLDRMIQQDWLQTYASVEGIALTLARLSRHLGQRFDRPVDLAPAASELLTLGDELAGDFHAFFPQLQAYVHDREPAIRAAAHPGRGSALQDITCG